jgi:hypothetical protein
MPASQYKYAHDKAFGQHHAETGARRELPAEMRDLDLGPGTVVEQVGTDEDTGRPILAWTDGTGTGRRTTVDPEFFAEHFEGI